MYPNDVVNKFNEDLHRNIKGATKGPALTRIAPYLLLNEDIVDIIFDFTKNICESDPQVSDLIIPVGCYLVFFDYGSHSYKDLLEYSPYTNKNDHYIIINGVEFANVTGISLDFMKERVSYNIIPSSSSIISKVRLNPSTFIDSDENTKKWLFKSVNPISYQLTRRGAFVK